VAVKSYNVGANGQREPDEKPEGPRPPAGAPILFIGWAGMVLGIGAIGGVIWAINGGFSVIGLEVVAGAFNNEGRIAWAWLSAWQFTPPVQLPGLNPSQPVVPWIGVAAASLLQVSVVLLKLLKLKLPWWLGVAAGFFSIYDWGSTFFGLGVMAWVQRIGIVLQGVLTTLITFSIEVVVAFLAKQVISALRPFIPWFRTLFGRR
jgi:hypothetical protein